MDEKGVDMSSRDNYPVGIALVSIGEEDFQCIEGRDYVTSFEAWHIGHGLIGTVTFEHCVPEAEDHSRSTCHSRWATERGGAREVHLTASEAVAWLNDQT